MRIAQVIALYPPEFRGGATLVCERLTRELAARGHVVDVFSGRTTAAEPLGAVRREPVGPALTWRVNLGGAFLPWSRENWDDRVATDSFARFLAEARPDVVHAHSLQALGVGVLRAAGAAGVPVVWTMHDWWTVCPCLFRLAPDGRPCAPIPHPERCSGRADVDFAARRDAILAAIADHVARILVPSAFLRDSLIANGLPAARIAVQENGVERPARGRERDAAAGPLRVAYVGGAGNREKGLGVLVDAAALLERADVEIDLHAVDPEEITAAPEAARARLRPRPRFDPEALDAVLASADVVVVPSLMRESCSLVTREALVRGVPVVTSDCGGPEEVVRSGKNGLVVATGSAAALAGALDRLADDRRLLARLAAAPAPEVPTPAAQAKAAEAVYRDVLRETEALRAARPAARVPAPAPGLRGRAILFLVGIDGAPLRYRAWHLVEQLAELGATARVLYHSDVDARAAAAAADCIVVYRAPFGVVVRDVVADARRRRVPVLFSADDLVFLADACDAPALDDPRPDVARGFRWTLDAYGRSFAAADAFLGSTEELVDAAAAAGMPSFLHRNGVGSALVAALHRARQQRVAREDAAAARRSEGRPLRVGFLSGTDTHDADLAAVAPALRAALERVPWMRLVLGGPVGLPADLAPFAARVERVPFVPWSDFAAHLADLDVSLAPLALSRRFNEAKSEVKLLEAALAGVPTIASPSRAFRVASADGDCALLAASAEEWEDAVVRLAGDADLRSALARRARRDVVRRYGPHVQAQALAETLNEVLERGSRTPAAELPEPIAVDGADGSSVALEPPDAAYAAHQLSGETAEALSPARVVEQGFECRADGLWRVDLLVATCWRRNRHDVVLTVRDEGDRALGTRVVDAATFVDRTHVAVPLDRPLAGSAGRTLRVRAEARGAGPGNEVLLWHGPSPEGGLAIDGRAIAGRALAFRAFGEPVA